MTSHNDISDKELWSYLTGAMAGQRCRDIDRRLAVDAELAARIETLQRGSDEWTASDRDDRDASEIRKVVASCAQQAIPSAT